MSGEGEALAILLMLHQVGARITAEEGEWEAPIVRAADRDLEGSARQGIDVLIFVVARTRFDRYEELRRQFEDWPGVTIVLDRREGERRTLPRTLSGVDRRRAERRHRLYDQPFLKLGWSVVDTDEFVS